MKKTIFITLCFLFSTVSGLSVQGVKAEKFADATAMRLMRSISPNTGNTPSANVYNWDFDTNTQRYTVNIGATWYARKCLMCSGESRLEIIGYLEVNRDGTNPEFLEISRNQAVRDAWSDRGVAAVVAAGAMEVGSAAESRN